jgi:Fic-DOC domain mobile mystery protein B
MGIEFSSDDGQTPLDEDEKEGLKLSTISTRGELDEFEQKNIEQALVWSMRQKFGKDRILTERFIRQLHQQMYGDVWKWAGEFRKTNKNIGVDKYQIGIELKMLLDDCRFWMDQQVYHDDEIAIRFKHRLVSIHCFPNGNGRHSRMMADIITEHVFNHKPFSWGGNSLVKKSELRSLYLSSIKKADAGDMDLLLDFSRS